MSAAPEEDLALVPDPRRAFDIAGRVVIVTGGTRGIGAALGRGLAVCGATVAVVGRNESDAESVVDDIRSRGGIALGVTADLAVAGDRSRVVDQVVAEYGRLDVLVNNAGISRRVPAGDVSRDDYESVHGLNAEAAFFLSQEAFPWLQAAGNGSIVNVLSTGMWTGGAGSILYRASKASLHAMTMVLAQEWAPHGVRVNAIAPGAINAGMGADLPPERVAVHLARTPMGRVGQAEELVPAVLLLASDAASYITGSVIRVDGGAVSQ